MDGEIRESVINLDALRKPAHRAELLARFQQMLREELREEESLSTVVCAVCEARPRVGNYSCCLSCQRFRQAMGAVMLKIPGASRPGPGTRRALVQNLTAGFGEELTRMIANGKNVYIGFHFPPAYFRHTELADVAAIFDRRNIRLFTSLSALKAHTSERLYSMRRNRDTFRAWLSEQDQTN